MLSPMSAATAHDELLPRCEALVPGLAAGRRRRRRCAGCPTRRCGRCATRTCSGGRPIAGGLGLGLEDLAQRHPGAGRRSALCRLDDPVPTRHGWCCRSCCRRARRALRRRAVVLAALAPTGTVTVVDGGTGSRDGGSGRRCRPRGAGARRTPSSRAGARRALPGAPRAEVEVDDVWLASGSRGIGATARASICSRPRTGRCWSGPPRGVISTVCEGADASVYFSSSPLQRLRDVEVLKGHVIFDWDRTAELAGRFALGFGLDRPTWSDGGAAAKGAAHVSRKGPNRP